jgi:hypothetical protein
MTISLSEELLVGLIGLALIPWIGWTVRRGLRLGTLPIGRAYVRREERRSAFNLLLGLYLAVGLMVGFIAGDLLLRISA